MPGYRRQILSLLRLPIPPLQPYSFLSVNCPNCNSSCKLGKIGKDKLSQFINRFTLCGIIGLGVKQCGVYVAVPENGLLGLQRNAVVVHGRLHGTSEAAPCEMWDVKLLAHSGELAPSTVLKREFP